jgi:hypothetical protein
MIVPGPITGPKEKSLGKSEFARGGGLPDYF